MVLWGVAACPGWRLQVLGLLLSVFRCVARGRALLVFGGLGYRLDKGSNHSKDTVLAEERKKSRNTVQRL